MVEKLTSLTPAYSILPTAALAKVITEAKEPRNIFEVKAVGWPNRWVTTAG